MTIFDQLRAMLSGIEYRLDAAIVDAELPAAYAAGVGDTLNDVRTALTGLEATSAQENLYSIQVVDRRGDGSNLVIVARPAANVAFVPASSRTATNPGKAPQDSATLRNVRLAEPGLEDRNYAEVISQLKDLQTKTRVITPKDGD